MYGNHFLISNPTVNGALISHPSKKIESYRVLNRNPRVSKELISHFAPRHPLHVSNNYAASHALLSHHTVR